MVTETQAPRQELILATDRLLQAFNQQIGNEMHASLQYISIATHLAGETLPELAKLFFAQADEEREHGMRFVHFIGEIGGKVVIPAIPSPKNDFSSVEEAVALALEWEKEVTAQIYNLMAIANEDNNYIAQRFLDYFVTEQLEEVNKMSSLLSMVRRAGDDLLYVEQFVARTGAEA